MKNKKIVIRYYIFTILCFCTIFFSSFKVLQQKQEEMQTKAMEGNRPKKLLVALLGNIPDGLPISLTNPVISLPIQKYFK